MVRDERLVMVVVKDLNGDGGERREMVVGVV